MPTQAVSELLEEARKAQRAQRSSIAKLKRLAGDSQSRDEAVEGLVQLWLEELASARDFAGLIDVVVELWERAYKRVKPFQQEVVTIEWLLDDEYAASSQEARGLLDLLGHFSGDQVGQHLREALQLADPRLKMSAAVSLLRRSDSVTPDEFEPIAASHLVRITLWEKLRELRKRSLMPARWAQPEALAASDLSRWLSFPTELNAPPEEIELMETFPIEDHDGTLDDAFLFRFREFPKPWEPGEGWMAGIAGPFRNGKALSSPWSSFKRWDSMSPSEHFDQMYYRGEDSCGISTTEKSE